MGFMGSVFKALGFESETKVKTKKPKTKATYKLKETKTNRLEQIDGVPVYYPETFEQTREFVEFVKGRRAIIISTDACEKETGNRILDFLRGFCYGANAKFIVLSEEKLYLILPEGMEVEE